MLLKPYHRIWIFFWLIMYKKRLKMKKIVILSMTFLFCLSAVQGQTVKTDKEKVKETKKDLKSERVALKKLEGTMVSDESKTAFYEDFSDAKNVTSKRDDTFDVFTFTNSDGVNLKAFYDIDSKLVGTIQSKQFSDLNPKVQEKIKKDYKDYTVGPVIFFRDNPENSTDMIVYGSQFDDADSYFVELSKGTKKTILQIDTEDVIHFFKEID